MKPCSRCGKDKPLESYNKKRVNKDGSIGYQPYCKECQKSWYSKYYHTDPAEKARLYNRNKTNRLALRDLVNKAKDKPCADCGVQYPYYVMQFDHLDRSQKSFTISTASRNGTTLARMVEEISKCDVVCANCHMERTFGHLNPMADGVTGNTPGSGPGDF
jgi:hypothetical protein